MKKEYSLNGQWQLVWNMVGEKKYEEVTWEDTINCKVPGDVHEALVSHKVIEEPSIYCNSEKCKWVEEQEFWYKKEFMIDSQKSEDPAVTMSTNLEDGKRFELEFEGLDLSADIWLNDQYLGRHENAFSSKVCDVTNKLKEGINVLVVRIDQGLEAVKDKPLEKMGLMWNNTEPYRAWMRKPQYVYGWDWTIWLPSCGIWKDVMLKEYESAYIEDTFIYEEFGNQIVEDGMNLTLQLDVTVGSVNSKHNLESIQSYQLECSIYSDNRFEERREVGSALIPCNIGINHMVIDMEQVQLWWPNLSGNPYLYDIEVTLRDLEGNKIDATSIKHGIRKVEIEEKELNEKEHGFTFVINDTPIFCKGANHVPLDCLPGKITDAKTIKIIDMAKECNMNMLRVWGGGIYESETFIRKCDEEGIMIWHDFMFACGFYPDFDEEYHESITEEVRQALLRTRNHTSVIGWSGNNEIQEMYLNVKGSNPDMPFYGAKIYKELLPSAVEKYCKNVIYRESSPYGREDDPAGIDEGDQHIWHFTHRPNYEHFMDLWRYTDFNIKFLSEYGIAGAMNVSSTKQCISEEGRNPDSKEWMLHSNTSQDNRILSNMIDVYFGDHKQYSMERFIYLSQLLQAELTRHIYDELQRRKFVCSGVLFWTLSDSLGIHNWALVDYYLRKRPVYYYLKQSQHPLKIAFEGYETQNSVGKKEYKAYFRNSPEDIAIWVINDYREAKQIDVVYQWMYFDGTILGEGKSSIEVKANCSEKVMMVPIANHDFKPEKVVLVATIIEDNKIIHENHYFFAPYDKVEVPKANIEYDIVQLGDDCIEVKLISDQYVWMLFADSDKDVEFLDNAMDLMPGVEKRLICKGKDIKYSDLTFYAMNTITVNK
ncbi:beta-mannosidase [Anaeromicropila herbilytica]|uniref:Beta-mannosidase B n=1 Tax=Anaeromicropila herbilytica TaxID=2785025 RepID=A0A7R7IBB7_9FIRM|nr:sugar-binding domain-containing protein [Anaeromicropila herbilytica]BCN29418.1 beta-mannosidase [Anaeromicropila herbilytica]